MENLGRSGIDSMLVSVIIPLYNRENTIKKAAESVLQQTYEDLELIIVDDCSTDRSVDVVRGMAKDDSRIRLLLSEKNGGACMARNKGIDAAKGEIVAFHDSDDIWHLDKLEKSLEVMEQEGSDMVFSSFRRIGKAGMQKGTCIIPEYDLNQYDNKFKQVLLKNCVSTQTIVIKKDVLTRVRFDERFPRFQDWEFSLQVLKQGFAVYFIKEALVDCYVLNDSITTNFDKADKAYRLLEKKYAKDLKRFPDVASSLYRDWGYQLEFYGKNGSEKYKKSYRLQPSKSGFMRYVLSKLRLYHVVETIARKIH